MHAELQKYGKIDSKVPLDVKPPKKNVHAFCITTINVLLPMPNIVAGTVAIVEVTLVSQFIRHFRTCCTLTLAGTAGRSLILAHHLTLAVDE